METGDVIILLGFVLAIGWRVWQRYRNEESDDVSDDPFVNVDPKDKALFNPPLPRLYEEEFRQRRPNRRRKAQRLRAARQRERAANG